MSSYFNFDSNEMSEIFNSDESQIDFGSIL